VDGSLNNIRSNYSLNSYVDGSLNNIRSNYIAAGTSLDVSLNGNVQLNRFVAINRSPNASFALDVSGSSNFTGNVNVGKRASDASYAYFDLSQVNLGLYNVSEKFVTVGYATTVTLDYSQGGVFYMTGTATNISTTVNITNVPTTLNRSISVSLIIPSANYFSATGNGAINVNGTSIAATSVFKPAAFTAPAAGAMVLHQFVIMWPTSSPTVLVYMSSMSPSL
jgi:hypothetical protein